MLHLLTSANGTKRRTAASTNSIAIGGTADCREVVGRVDPMLLTRCGRPGRQNCCGAQHRFLFRCGRVCSA